MYSQLGKATYRGMSTQEFRLWFSTIQSSQLFGSGLLEVVNTNFRVKASLQKILSATRQSCLTKQQSEPETWS